MARAGATSCKEAASGTLNASQPSCNDSSDVNVCKTIKLINLKGFQISRRFFVYVSEQDSTGNRRQRPISNLTKPEAIELAVDVRDIDDFLDQLDQLESIESVSPEIATQLLKKMEVDSVCQNGFGTFAELSG